MKALIVDDSLAARFLIGKIVRALGFETVEADHGRTALTVLAENPDVDIALVDWNMPEMPGLELVETMRKTDGLKTMPVIMVTTETSLDQVSKAIEAGANEYIMKPFNEDVVKEKLKLIGFFK